MATLSSICSNDAGWKWACACWPLVLIWQATDVYIISCFSVVLWRLWTMICYPFLICCGTWQYSDKDFTGQGAIGAVDGEIVDAEWVRADELASRGKDGKPQKMKLYEGKVEPRDLVQGAVGDCWMVAALACSAEHPPCIRNAFLTREYNPRGSYRVRMYALGRIELGFRFRFRAGSGPSEHGPRACTDLWTPIGSRVRSFDGQTGSWVVITVDDHVPCRRGTRQPIYCKLHGNELWAVLLEKAFAKFCGSYASLDGGFAAWAWRALTGDNVFRLSCVDGRVWQRLDFKNLPSQTGDKRACGFYATDEKYKPDEAWVLIQKYLRADCFVAASGGEDMSGGAGTVVAGVGRRGEATADNGLVGTHAYSVLDAVELGLIPGLKIGSGLLGQTRLVKLRNPWGSYEWKGAWSDGSKEWAEHPIIRARLRPRDEDDGTFWMPLEDFSKIFTKIDICDRTTKHDLKLRVHEDCGACGVVAGCLGGLADFVCLCRGLRVLYCGQTTSTVTKSAERNCCGCVGGPLGGAPDDAGTAV